ncbi:hypothetical protein V502_09204 [Pseudogymnoascus sp. VKM F-4520 (FW-2644)]|nr:hypothetical protein V502_09204 [Pseudogymnoascus sp. VKM F-4520 (FW-2644)]
MHFSLSTFAIVALSTYQAAALGINCRGSSNCAAGVSAMGDIADAMDQGIADGNGDRFYDNGVQMACARTIVVGWVCAFWQFAEAKGTLQDGRNYVKSLQDHDCVNCGSVPLAPGNPDVNTGALTVNVVTSPCCVPGTTKLSCYC